MASFVAAQPDGEASGRHGQGLGYGRGSRMSSVYHWWKRYAVESARTSASVRAKVMSESVLWPEGLAQVRICVRYEQLYYRTHMLVLSRGGSEVTTKPRVSTRESLQLLHIVAESFQARRPCLLRDESRSFSGCEVGGRPDASGRK